MTISTTIDSTSGVKSVNSSSSGLSVTRDTNNAGFSPFKVYSVKAVTTGSTLLAGDAGVSTISGSQAWTVVMPTAASCPGASFIFRTLSPHAHILTGSQEVGGTKVFCRMSSSLGGALAGSKLTFDATLGTSVALMSDGVSFLVVGASGSVAIS